MKRRTFLKQAGTAFGGISIPYLLPSGRLFAASGQRYVNHVVLFLYAGGVRNIESVQKAEGNLMPHTLYGKERISSDIVEGMTSLPLQNRKPLQVQGTLFKEFRFSKGPTAHISAHLTVISGKYQLNGHDPKQRPSTPTLFEFYRKHHTPKTSPLNAWWIADREDPFFNFSYSKANGYGAAYGANYVQPKNILGKNTHYNLGQSPLFSENELQSISKVRGLSNQHFQRFFQPGDAGVLNNEADAIKFRDFVLACGEEAHLGQHEDPWKIGASVMNADMYNVFYTEKIIQAFQPELTVVNMLEIDRGHTDFTLYCDNIRKADFALNHLWQTIQNTPGMANDTVLIAVPEHGRNLQPNTLLDKYGRNALDHTSDPTSREIFCLVLGPPEVIQQNKIIHEVKGESIDVVPTIAKILGFYEDISIMLEGKPLIEIFV